MEAAAKEVTRARDLERQQQSDSHSMQPSISSRSAPGGVGGAGAVLASTDVPLSHGPDQRLQPPPPHPAHSAQIGDATFAAPPDEAKLQHNGEVRKGLCCCCPPPSEQREVQPDVASAATVTGGNAENAFARCLRKCLRPPIPAPASAERGVVGRRLGQCCCCCLRPTATRARAPPPRTAVPSTASSAAPTSINASASGTTRASGGAATSSTAAAAARPSRTRAAIRANVKPMAAPPAQPPARIPVKSPAPSAQPPAKTPAPTPRLAATPAKGATKGLPNLLPARPAGARHVRSNSG